MLSGKKIIIGWNHFFYDKVDVSTLSLFRIILGFFLFLSGISLLPDLGLWMGVDSGSLVPLQDSLRFYSNVRVNVFEWLAPTETSAWLVVIGFTLTALGLMIGFFTRVCSLLCFIFLVSLQNRNYVILNSGDTLMRCMLFPLIFSPCHYKFSVDAFFKKNHGYPYPHVVPSVSLRLLQLQLCIVYLSTFLFKLKGYDWVDGTAVYYTSRLQNFQRLTFPIIFDVAVLTRALTWSALIIEFCMATLIWVKECRTWVLILGIMLHLGIEMTMSIGIFEWVMMGCYVLFLDPMKMTRGVHSVYARLHFLLSFKKIKEI